jgi:hypothetical protein
MQGVKAFIGVAVPGRPIGPWSRRTGAPKASATGRDRASVRAGSVAHGDRRPADLQLKQLARRQPADQIVVPKVGARTPSITATPFPQIVICLTSTNARSCSLRGPMPCMAFKGLRP